MGILYKLELSTDIKGKMSILRKYCSPGTVLVSRNKMVKNIIYMIDRILKWQPRSLLLMCVSCVMSSITVWVASVNTIAITPMVRLCYMAVCF